MMFKNWAFLFVVMLAACSEKNREEIEIFNAACETCASYWVDGKAEIRDSVLLIENPADTVGHATLHINGHWDLSVYNRLKVELVNANSSENITAVITIAEDTTANAKGSLETSRLLYYNSGLNWEIEVPPAMPHPEIAGYFAGMRATPYTLNGISSTLQPEKAGSISISFENALAGVRMGIRRIIASKGPKVELPAWTQLDKEKLFPMIDRYGQFIHKDWLGKTRSDSDLIAAREKEAADLLKHTGDSNWCSYGGYTSVPLQEATGHFYVKKLGGKWWMVDPDGHLFWSHGVVRVVSSSAVTPLDNRKYLFSGLPEAQSPFSEFYKTQDEKMLPYYLARGIKETYDFSASNLKRKYGDQWRTLFNNLVHQRLRSWGMNTISAASDKTIYLKNRTPYCDRIEPVSPVIDGVSKGLMAMRDPFHPAFVKSLKDALAQRKEELNSSWCYGYAVDNKISWGKETDLANWVLQSSGTQPAKIAFCKFLKEKYNSVENLDHAWGTNYKDWDQLLAERVKAPQQANVDLRYFSNAIVEKYFSETSKILRQAAPGKLYLGCRFNTMNERVIKIAAQYADVLSFDLFFDSLADFSLPNGIDKPVLIGEFHFGAVDRGLFHPGLNERASQEQRGKAYGDYVTSAVKNPFIIGTSWHQFSDQATTGRFDGENFQDGLTDVCDLPYKETIDKVRELGYNMYRLRLKN